jgi:hypothetical protein
MGATASLQPEVFTLAKEEYEIKKNAGLTDEELFNHMKTFIEAKTAEFEKAKAAEPASASATTSGAAAATTTTESENS